jgi:hypothetical protein
MDQTMHSPPSHRWRSHRHCSTQLFAVFLVSIITLVIVPYTAYLLFGGDDDSVRYDFTL